MLDVVQPATAPGTVDLGFAPLAAAVARPAPFMFATGIENSAPTIQGGRVRRDQMAE